MSHAPAIPRLPLPDSARLAGLPAGAAGTRETLRLMAFLAKRYSTNLRIITLARQIVAAAGVAPKDYAGEAGAIQAWVQEHVAYRRDVAGVETVQTPLVTLALASGDCDDQSCLVSCLVLALGNLHVRYEVVGASREALSHVFCSVLLGRQWVALETTEPWEFGQRPPNLRTLMVQHV